MEPWMRCQGAQVIRRCLGVLPCFLLRLCHGGGGL